KAIVKTLGYPELDAPLPLTGLSPLLGGGADQRRVGVLFFQIFAYGYGLADTLAVVQFERGYLAARIAIGIRGLAVLSLHQIDYLGRNRKTFFDEKHAGSPRIRSKAVVQKHNSLRRIIYATRRYRTLCAQVRAAKPCRTALALTLCCKGCPT